jgi:DnaJ-class molecular chaperone
MKDPYTVLGVSKTATQDEIKKAYRALAKKLHPDLNPGNSVTATRFKEVTGAYDLIGTKEARAKFDSGETDQQSNAGNSNKRQQWSDFYGGQQNGGRYARSFGEGFDGADFFESLFGGKKQKKNQDIHYTMDVDFKNAALGGEKTITLANGKTIKVKIPSGITSGTKLRFKGQGENQMNDLPPGDAIIEVSVIEDEIFKRNGMDIESTATVDFFDAILGGEIPIETIHGKLKIKIPPETHSGKKLRIQGKGIHANGVQGNHIVKIMVDIPQSISPELKNSLKSIRDRHKETGTHV